MTDADLAAATSGDINAFHRLFAPLKSPLKSYIYRLVSDRNDADDLTHDVFVKAFDKIATFRQESSLKTWVFAIATNLAYDFLKGRRRWPVDILDLAKQKAGEEKYVRDFLQNKAAERLGSFNLKEHIAFCFTCIAKTLILNQQIALILIDIYEFTVKDAAMIMGKGEAAVKHYIRLARMSMTKIYDNRCALVNKKGACHQCSELAQWLNPDRSFREQKQNIAFIEASESSQNLFELRKALVKTVDPLTVHGADLHDAFMRLHRLCLGEIEVLEN